MSLILDALRRASRRKSEAESRGELGRIPTMLPTSFFSKRGKLLSLRLKLLLVPVAAVALLVALSISHLNIKSMLGPVATMKTRAISKIPSHGTETFVQEKSQRKDASATREKQEEKIALSVTSETKERQAFSPQRESEKGSSLRPRTSTEAEGAREGKYTLSRPVKPPDKAAVARGEKYASPQGRVTTGPPASARQEHLQKKVSTPLTTEKMLSSLSPKTDEAPVEKPAVPSYRSYREDKGDSSRPVNGEKDRKAIEHFNTALAHQRGKEYDSALQEYEKALKLDPYNATIYNNLGMIYRDMRRLNEAIRMYKKALFLQPSFEKAHNNLGVAYYIKGKLKKAEQEFLKAVSIEPGNVESYVNLGLVYSKMGLTHKAMEALTKAIKLDPDNPHVHYNLAILLEKEESYQEAKEHYTRFLFLSPEASEDMKKQVAEHIRNLSLVINR